MITRYDRIATSLPEPKGPNPNAASLVQELLGGKFGEMSTLMNYTFQSFNFRGRNDDRGPAVLRSDRQHRRRRVWSRRGGHLHDQHAAHRRHDTRHRSDRHPAGGDGERPQLLPLHGQWPAGAPVRLHGQSVDWAERLLQRQPQAGSAAQLLPGVRCPRQQDPGLRDDRRPDGARDDGLPAGSRWRPRRGLRASARSADRRGSGQALPDSGHQQQAVPGSEGARRHGPAHHPLSERLQGLRARRRGLDREAP